MNFTLTMITFSVCRLLRHVDPNVTIYSLDLCSKIDTTANITPFCTHIRFLSTLILSSDIDDQFPTRLPSRQILLTLHDSLRRERVLFPDIDLQRSLVDKLEYQAIVVHFFRRGAQIVHHAVNGDQCQMLSRISN